MVKKKEAEKTNFKIDTKWLQLALVMLTILFYFNTATNTFSFKDDLVSIQNPENPNTLRDIPEVFTTPYADQNGFLITYRPLSRATYAIEYQFSADSKNNPQISHILNLLLYLISILLLFGLLKRLFKEYNVWFPFMVTLLFMAHPLHTEVVYNLRNRDFLLAFVFSLLALRQFIGWIDTKKALPLVVGSLAFFLALLSHETALVMLAVFPLALYYFTKISRKQIFQITTIEALIAIAALAGPMLYLTNPGSEINFIDNPLVRENGLMARIAAFFSTLGWSLRMLVFPFPLRFYYGYDVVSITDWSNIWLWASVAVNTLLLFIALKGINKKSFISFVIILYFITTIPYSNLFILIPGIVYERLLFISVLSFSMAIVWLIYTLLGNNAIGEPSKIKIAAIGLFFLLVLGPYFMSDFHRGKEWGSEGSIINADLEKLENSAGLQNYLAERNLQPIIAQMKQTPNPYQFLLTSINNVEDLTWNTLDRDTLFTPGYERLGFIYSQMHGKQAFLRYESFKAKGNEEKATEAERDLLTYFLMAETYFDKALEFGSKDSANVYFLKSEAYAIQYRNDDAALALKKAMELEPTNRKYYAKFIDALLHAGRFKMAISENELFRQKFPDSDVPDRNLAGYYYFKGDTLNAIKHYEMAVQKGTKPEVGKLLHKYYTGKGDTEKANYYIQKAYESEKYYDPEKY